MRVSVVDAPVNSSYRKIRALPCREEECVTSRHKYPKFHYRIITEFYGTELGVRRIFIQARQPRDSSAILFLIALVPRLQEETERARGGTNHWKECKPYSL